MRLREALGKAVKFCWSGKQNSPTKSVRFLPSTSGRDAVYATNGPQGILVGLDDDIRVPNVMIDGELIANVIKTVRECTIEAGNNGDVKLAGITVKSGAVNEYPAIPQVPVAPAPFPDWWVVQKIMHAASKDKQQPALQCLHFRPDLVETSDRYRVARAFVKAGYSGLVPIELFKGMPDGDVSVAFTDTMAVFAAGDEWRLSMLRRAVFQDCDPLLPVWRDGPRASVDAAELLDVMKRAKALSDVAKIIFFPRTDGQPGALQVHCGGLSVSVSTQTHEVASTTLQVNATWLFEALRNVSTPRVLLGYINSQEPLRVESGPYVVGLWPFKGE